MENDNFQTSNQPFWDTQINLRHYWHVVLERRWLVITAFISVFVLSLIYLFKATPIFQATARLQINREVDNVITMQGFSIESREQDYLQTQYKNLLSRTLIEKVVAQLKLAQDPRYSKAIDKPFAVAHDISIAPIRLSRLVDIKVEHPDPKQAALIANNLVTNFIAINLDRKIAASTDVAKKLEEEAKQQEKRVGDAEVAVAAFKSTHNVTSFDNVDNIMLQALKTYQNELDAASSTAAAAQQTIDEVDRLLKEGKPIETIPQVASNPAILDLNKELAVLEARFAQIKKRYKWKHPEYEGAQQQIDSVKASIKRQADAIIASLHNAALIAKATESKMAEALKNQDQKYKELNKLRAGYEPLKRQAEQSALLYSTVLAAVKEKQIAGRHTVNNMVVIDEADVPLKPIKPRIVLTLFLGLFGGLAVAIGLAFFVNYLDDSIKSQDDVETYLRLPFLGYIPNIKSNSVVERDLQAHLHPQSNSAEGFRTIRATISLTHKPDQFRIVAVTSTIPAEGKSLVASNLGIVTAQTGLKTLLVDADLRRPSVHKAYQLHSPVGLSSFLLEETNHVDPLIHKTEVANLDVVCCGAVPSNPSELIGSKRMAEFLDLMRSRYDRIMLDCPPISAVSDPLILAAMSDGVVFVTKFNKVRREHAKKSIQRVQNAGIHIVGLVLNDIDFEGRESYYYSYYYYQNRYYASHYTPERAKEKSSNLAKTRN